MSGGTGGRGEVRGGRHGRENKKGRGHGCCHVPTTLHELIISIELAAARLVGEDERVKKRQGRDKTRRGQESIVLALEVCY